MPRLQAEAVGETAEEDHHNDQPKKNEPEFLASADEASGGGTVAVQLEHPDARVREAAVYALGRIPAEVLEESEHDAQGADDGGARDGVEPATTEPVIELPHGVELRALSTAIELRADMFEVTRRDAGKQRASPDFEVVSDVLHIRALDPSVPFPLVLKMPHRVTAAEGRLDDLERLTFRRAAEAGQEPEVVEGGTFSSAGYASIEVESFSEWHVAVMRAAITPGDNPHRASN